MAGRLFAPAGDTDDQSPTLSAPKSWNTLPAYSLCKIVCLNGLEHQVKWTAQICNNTEAANLLLYRKLASVDMGHLWSLVKEYIFGSPCFGSPLSVRLAQACEGKFVRTWGSRGSGQGQFSIPYGVAVESGHVYVTDSNNHRIQVFTTAGTFVRTWGSDSSGQGQFSYPKGVAVESGHVYVADRSNHRIQVF